MDCINNLRQLYQHYGQSPWLDNIRRDWIRNGELQRYVERGIRGVTSNPSIFQKAISSTDDYAEEFTGAVQNGASIEDAYWSLVVSDIVAAAGILDPVYEESDGHDGYVSVEVSPHLARDSTATESAARDLHKRLGIPNVYIKIPGTQEGAATNHSNDFRRPQHQRHINIRCRTILRCRRCLYDWT